MASIRSLVLQCVLEEIIGLFHRLIYRRLVHIDATQVDMMNHEDRFHTGHSLHFKSKVNLEKSVRAVK
jgi:hypothetical protein